MKSSLQNWFQAGAVVAIAVCWSVYGLAQQTQLNGLADQSNAPVYLALGDSYPFGTACVTTPCPSPDTLLEVNNDNYWVGYPEYLQVLIDRPLVNAGCPGDTTTSFLTTNTEEGARCLEFKAAGLLHVGYTGVQMDFAEQYLASHDRVTLVTLQLGGPETNAFFTSCGGASSCILAGLPAHEARMAANLETILSRIRGAGYTGQLVYVEYPARRYNTFIAQVMAQIYADLAPVFGNYGVEMAPVFDRFETAVQSYGGNSCAAGLLITLAGGACNVHPTAAGHQLIASIIAEMVPGR